VVKDRRPDELDVLAGRYRVGEVLGRGGMGTVVRAYDEVLDRSVAIKFLRDDLAGDGPAAARFRREARIAASLAHPGIAQVYDLAQEEGRPFIVMELLDGCDLQVLTGRGAVVDPGVAAGIVARAAEALGFAHAAGAVHRDVKPGNIVLTRAGTVKVTDFGVASAAQQVPLTETGRVLGTSWYVSPEQARGERAGTPSDVYALGCVLFQLLTGRPPFQAETSVAVAMAHISDPVPSPRDANPAVPPELDSIVRRAMAKDPARRFRDGSAMAAALETTGLVPAAMSLAVADRPTDPVAVSLDAEAAVRTGTVRAGPPTELLFDGEPVPLTVGPVTPVADLPPAAGLAGGAGHRSRRRLRRFAFLALLAVVGAAVVAAGMALRPRPVPPVVLPDWTGRNAQDAAAEARGMHLDVRAASQSSLRPKDEVLGQQPAPRSSVPVGSAVTFSVSLGDQVQVPDVTGGTLDEARSTLAASDLAASVSEVRPVDNLPAPLKQLRDLGLDLSSLQNLFGQTEEVVEAQDQRPGATVARGSTVRLTIVRHLVRDQGDDGATGDAGHSGKDKQKSRGND
jgi:eukaryotic-like serine/threonine-protein kinase